ncbi:DUF6230 family protein [Halorientalis brevis]|uniref:DUF6230 family protein n=1 Tax=Halorientalis brevis TaxID=1126241 RepID=A0ABD6CAI5_9EURY|nr:DUF6230 family protein [Halorientalis brevis]
MYDTNLLAKSTGASLGVVALVGVLFLSTGTAFAMPVAGIGGFQIQADSIEGDDLLLYPGLADGSNEDDYPHSIVELRNNEIEDLRLTKTLDLSDYSDSVDGRARLVIESGGTVTIDRLLLKTPKLSADEATFSGLEISESDSDTLEESFSIRAPSDPPDTRQIELDGGSNPGLEMTDANIRATYLATDEITLPDLELKFQYDSDDDGDYEYT